MSVAASLNTPQSEHSKQPRSVSTAFSDHYFTFSRLVYTLQLLFVSRHKVNKCVVLAAEWCAKDGTIGAFDGCITVVKFSTIPSCTRDLLYKRRHLFLRIYLIEMTRHNNKRIWMRILWLGNIHGSQNYS